jgi:Txe/YoeB family toxin of toxin-antitoxin system
MHGRIISIGNTLTETSLRRINTLLKEIQRTPFEGIGKPEPLRHSLSGYWSRRINEEHRIVYKINTDSLDLFSPNEPRAAHGVVPLRCAPQDAQAHLLPEAGAERSEA